MDRQFSIFDPIERDRGERRETSMPRIGLATRSFGESISRSHRPLHPRLIGPGAILLIAALATDITYANSLLFQWDNISVWLIAGGLVLAAFAGLALAFDIATHRIRGINWLRFSGFVAAALLSLVNVLVHTRDAYTAVVPQGLALSALVTVILVIIGWRGWSVGARHSFRSTNSEETHS